MQCPECGANMPAEGTCPSCGHLVLGDSIWDEDVQADAKTGAPPLPHASAPGPKPMDKYPDEPGQTFQIGDSMVQARDYTALLLGVVIYSVLLHPSLAIFATRLAPTWARYNVAWFALGYIPLSYIITRLMCTIDPETRRWKIRNATLRRLFTWLNSLWF